MLLRYFCCIGWVRKKFFSCAEIIFSQSKYSKDEYYSRKFFVDTKIQRNLQHDEEEYDFFMMDLQSKPEKILFDSTPMLNIFSLCADKYFPG